MMWTEELDDRPSLFRRLCNRIRNTFRGYPGPCGPKGDPGISAPHVLHLGNGWHRHGKIVNESPETISNDEYEVLSRLEVTDARIDTIRVSGRGSDGKLQVSVEATDTSPLNLINCTLTINSGIEHGQH